MEGVKKRYQKYFANNKIMPNFERFLSNHLIDYINELLLIIKNVFLTNQIEIKTAMAGTLESGDIFIQIAPNDNAGLHIDLDSTVAYQFGDQIKKVITETLQGLGIDQAEVKATDKGALDCTIRARVTAAAVRATGKDVWAD